MHIYLFDFINTEAGLCLDFLRISPHYDDRDEVLLSVREYPLSV